MWQETERFITKLMELNLGSMHRLEALSPRMAWFGRRSSCADDYFHNSLPLSGRRRADSRGLCSRTGRGFTSQQVSLQDLLGDPASVSMTFSAGLSQSAWSSGRHSLRATGKADCCRRRQSWVSAALWDGSVRAPIIEVLVATAQDFGGVAGSCSAAGWQPALRCLCWKTPWSSDPARRRKVKVPRGPTSGTPLKLVRRWIRLEGPVGGEPCNPFFHCPKLWEDVFPAFGEAECAIPTCLLRKLPAACRA